MVLLYGDGTHSCTVTGCLVERSGYHGIDITGGTENTISNCLVRYCGELRGHGRGVYAGADSDHLSHLEVYNVARSGICTGSNTTVSYVKVHDCVSGQRGSGHLLSLWKPRGHFQPMYILSQLLRICGILDRPPTAVYNDRDAPDTTWSNIDAGDSQMFIFASRSGVERDSYVQ